MLKANRSIGSGEVFLKAFTTYRRGRHLGHVTKSSCVIFFFHYSKKLSHDIWFQITQQFLRKQSLSLKNGVTFEEGQIMTLSFDIHVAS